ncbi:hypothetical protein BKA15_000426 [Microlunatus parietis]|uniref:Uncharacterized protein n=1 Tax=Microlunatus parietis TaxID=682979 RepID=A0A7Y9I2L1_9ACTN|nr:hypothetical protein [Microlunatus parietis]
MRPAKAKLKKFRLNPKYTHHRSEGLTRRQNAGTKLLIIGKKTGSGGRQPTDGRRGPG